ncbi:MAG: toxin-activating lysine-acyltransferase [Alphaproteobacteria bacterium]|nr:toxin-activating lysine-acyltransferase [Alphaproteobacteria bacterium]
MARRTTKRTPKKKPTSPANKVEEAKAALEAAMKDEAAKLSAPPRQLDKVGILGHVTWLMTQSPLHRHLFVTDLEWLVMPALALNQFRIWHGSAQQAAGIPASQVQGGSMPIGFASWAYLDEEAEARIKQGIKQLRATDWKAGDSLWLIDLIMPFGGMEKAVQELKRAVFKDKVVKSLQPSPSGEGVAVVEW